MQDKLDVAETFLDRVTAQEGENVVAWTLYAMLYEQKGQDMNAEITLKKALKINQNLLAEQQAALINDSHVEDNAEHASSVRKEDGICLNTLLFFLLR